ncbi:MAG: flagellin [Thermoplasmataceae archaeon]
MSKTLVTLKKLLRKYFSLKSDVKSETGIGVLIIFIAMVLVAAVAATVLLHTVSVLELKATQTGTTTIDQVSGGIAVKQIIGYDSANPPAAGGVKFLAIFVAPLSGASSVNLGNVSISLSINGDTSVLVYNSSLFNDVSQSGTVNLFGLGIWSNLSSAKHDATNFGVIAYFNPTGRLTANFPTISGDDQAIIALNVTNAFGTNITQGMQVSGQITPEAGTPALIDFNAPVAFNSKSITLQ